MTCHVEGLARVALVSTAALARLGKPTIRSCPKGPQAETSEKLAILAAEYARNGRRTEGKNRAVPPHSHLIPKHAQRTTALVSTYDVKNCQIQKFRANPLKKSSLSSGWFIKRTLQRRLTEHMGRHIECSSIISADRKTLFRKYLVFKLYYNFIKMHGYFKYNIRYDEPFNIYFTYLDALWR